MKKIFLMIWICCLNFAFHDVLAEQPLVNINGSQSKTELNIAPLDVAKLKSGKQTLRVGHYNQLPPFFYSNSPAQPGFGHDIFVEVAKKAGVPRIEFMGYDNNVDLNTLLKQGRIDVIANSWDLPGMRKQFLLTTPYYSKGGLSFLYYKNKGSFQNTDDLKDHIVGALQKGYAARYWLPIHGVDKESIKLYETLKELLFALKDGDIDVAIIYHPLALLAQQQLSDQLTVNLVQPINDVYAVRQQDNDLQALLDEAIKSLNQEGILDKIQVQYLEPSSPKIEQEEKIKTPPAEDQVVI
jgi:ABC-type amino acid transport substrate-binding protein